MNVFRIIITVRGNVTVARFVRCVPPPAVLSVAFHNRWTAITQLDLRHTSPNKGIRVLVEQVENKTVVIVHGA
jgi:hypothetical protein